MMKREILEIALRIKENLKSIDDDGVYHSLLDTIYEDIEQIEEVIHNDDMNIGYGIETDEEYD
jgi:hypothetical protein